MYTGLNFFLLKQKLTPKDEAILTRLIKENDGTIVDGQDRADRIITCLRSKSRVERNLDNVKKKKMRISRFLAADQFARKRARSYTATGSRNGS